MLDSCCTTGKIASSFSASSSLAARFDNCPHSTTNRQNNNLAETFSWGPGNLLAAQSRELPVLHNSTSSWLLAALLFFAYNSLNAIICLQPKLFTMENHNHHSALTRD